MLGDEGASSSSDGGAHDCGPERVPGIPATINSPFEETAASISGGVEIFGGTDPIMGDVTDPGDPALVFPLLLLLPGDIRGLSLSWIPCFNNFLHFDRRF